MPPQNLSAFTPQVWSKKVLKRLDQINVMRPLVNRDYEGDIRKQGDTVWVRTFGDVVMADYTKNGNINYTALSPSKESLVIQDAKYAAIQVDDLDAELNDLSALDGYTDRMAVKISNVVEAKMLSFYGSAITANQITNSGSPYTVSASNAYSLIVKAKKALTKQNAPLEGRWMVIDPDYESYLIQDSTFFIRATDMGDQIVQSGRLTPANKTPGFIGRVAGFDVYVSNALPTVSGNTYCQFGAGPVISYAGVIRKFERIRRESSFSDAVRALLLHDGAVFAENAKAFGHILKVAA